MNPDIAELTIVNLNAVTRVFVNVVNNFDAANR